MPHDFEQWIDSLYRFALNLCRDPDLAEDLCQEALLKGYRARHRLREGEKLKPWLFQILANTWRDSLRRKKELAVDPSDLPETPMQGGQSRCVESRELLEIALERMKQLPERQRNVLFLITVENLSHSQVAEVLDISSQSVKTNLSIARKTMRNWMENLRLETEP